MNGSPLWNTTSSRNLKVYVRPSSDTVHDSARAGSNSKSSLIHTNGSNIWLATLPALRSAAFAPSIALGCVVSAMVNSPPPAAGSSAAGSSAAGSSAAGSSAAGSSTAGSSAAGSSAAGSSTAGSSAAGSSASSPQAAAIKANAASSNHNSLILDLRRCVTDFLL